MKMKLVGMCAFGAFLTSLVPHVMASNANDVPVLEGPLEQMAVSIASDVELGNSNKATNYDETGANKVPGETAYANLRGSFPLKSEVDVSQEHSTGLINRYGKQWKMEWGCVSGNNIKSIPLSKVPTGQNPLDYCMDLCVKYGSRCKGVEWFTTNAASYNAGHCVLSSSANTAGCDNDKYKVEFWKIIGAAASNSQEYGLIDRAAEQWEMQWGCVNGHNLKIIGIRQVPTGKVPLDYCMSECMKHGSGCKGIEWFTEDSSYKKYDCMLSSGIDTAGCGNDYYKVEFWKRRDDADTCNQENKLVQIYKFWINGEHDGNGVHGEHQLKFDGRKYFPNYDYDCTQDPTGFCSWREGLVQNIESRAPWRLMKARDSLTVGTEEHDPFTNDSISAALTSEQWNVDTCQTYEVKISRDFQQKKDVTSCTEISFTGSFERNGASGGATGTKSTCESWTEPAQSFIWYLHVQPAPICGPGETLVPDNTVKRGFTCKPN